MNIIGNDSLAAAPARPVRARANGEPPTDAGTGFAAALDRSMNALGPPPPEATAPRAKNAGRGEPKPDANATNASATDGVAAMLASVAAQPLPVAVRPPPAGEHDPERGEPAAVASTDALVAAAGAAGVLPFNVHSSLAADHGAQRRDPNGAAADIAPVRIDSVTASLAARQAAASATNRPAVPARVETLQAGLGQWIPDPTAGRRPVPPDSTPATNKPRFAGLRAADGAAADIAPVRIESVTAPLGALPAAASATDEPAKLAGVETLQAGLGQPVPAGSTPPLNKSPFAGQSSGPGAALGDALPASTQDASADTAHRARGAAATSAAPGAAVTQAMPPSAAQPSTNPAPATSGVQLPADRQPSSTRFAAPSTTMATSPAAEGMLPPAVAVGDVHDSGERQPRDARSEAPTSGVDLAAALASGIPAGPPLAVQGRVEVAAPVGSPEWPAALGQQLALLPHAQEVELDLHPAELGPLKVKLSLQDGQAQLTFVAASPLVRDAIEAALPQLKINLAEHGIALGQTSVGSGSGQAHAHYGSPHDQGGERAPQPGAARPREPALATEAAPHARTRRGTIDDFA
jgi:flagellar hook-length control protein FliK